MARWVSSSSARSLSSRFAGSPVLHESPALLLSPQFLLLNLDAPAPAHAVRPEGSADPGPRRAGKGFASRLNTCVSRSRDFHARDRRSTTDRSASVDESSPCWNRPVVDVPPAVRGEKRLCLFTRLEICRDDPAGIESGFRSGFVRAEFPRALQEVPFRDERLLPFVFFARFAACCSRRAMNSVPALSRRLQHRIARGHHSAR